MGAILEDFPHTSTTIQQQHKHQEIWGVLQSNQRGETTESRLGTHVLQRSIEPNSQSLSLGCYDILGLGIS